MASLSMQLGHEASPGLSKSFVRSQLLTKPQRAPADIDLTGQVAIITGGSAGLGYHSASHFLNLKLSHLILAVRSMDRGKSAARKLCSKYPTAKIDVWHLEMTSYQSIQAFCRQVEEELPRLDITILNAGIIKGQFNKCSTGHEEVIQVNYLSTFLLAILMLPLSKNKAPAGRPGRLTIVSSETALWAKFPNRDKRPLLPSFDYVDEIPWDSVERYFSSKMLGHLFFARLLPYLNRDEVIVNLVEPGMCKGSDLHREARGGAGVFLRAFKALTGRKPEDGAWTYVDAAVVKGRESHGCFCMDWKIHKFTELVYLPEGQPVMDALWKETIAEFEFAGVREILKM